MSPAREGYREAARIEDAELIVLNTCHIRERASEKIYSELGKMRELKDERRAAGRRTTIVVAGCVAQAEGREILRRQPAVDVVVGPQNYHRLPELLREAARAARRRHRIPARGQIRPSAGARARGDRARAASAAFVTVQEGCDKFCSFCVVPYTRGAETSRPVAKVLAEIARLVGAGVREVTLIGQNVNAYHGIDAQGGARDARRAHRRRGRDSRRRADPLRDLASERHERRPDRRAREDRGAGALSPSAGPVGLGPDSGAR